MHQQPSKMVQSRLVNRGARLMSGSPDLVYDLSAGGLWRPTFARRAKFPMSVWTAVQQVGLEKAADVIGEYPFRSFTVADNGYGLVAIAVDVGTKYSQWTVMDPERAMEWYNLFVGVFGEPQHLSFFNFGADNGEITAQQVY